MFYWICFNQPVAQVGRGNDQAVAGEGGGGVEGLKVWGGDEPWCDRATTSQRGQSQVEREARAARGGEGGVGVNIGPQLPSFQAAVLLLDPAVGDQLVVVVLLDKQAGNGKRWKVWLLKCV